VYKDTAGVLRDGGKENIGKRESVVRKGIARACRHDKILACGPWGTRLEYGGPQKTKG